jgi:hypothetical protein
MSDEVASGDRSTPSPGVIARTALLRAVALAARHGAGNPGTV